MSARKRGGTFTVIVLVASVFLLGIGGAFARSAQTLTQLVGERERNEQAKEALAGGAEWAREALDSWASTRTEEKATLRYSRARVDVALQLRDGTVTADLTAKVSPDVVLHARAALERRGTRWTIVRYDVQETR